MYKTNEFVHLKPRVQTTTDRVIVTLPAASREGDKRPQYKLCNVLTKLNENLDSWVEKSELLEYFDIS